MLHVSFQPPNSPFPAVLPMIGQMGSFKRPSADVGEVLDLYLHGLVNGPLPGDLSRVFRPAHHKLSIPLST